MLDDFYVLHHHLVIAQRDRHLRPFSVMPSRFGGSLSWLDYEKLVMFGEVNRLRIAAGRDTIEYEEIEAAEQLASGHSDYTKKFALYCAELVAKT